MADTGGGPASPLPKFLQATNIFRPRAKSTGAIDEHTGSKEESSITVKNESNAVSISLGDDSDKKPNLPRRTSDGVKYTFRSIVKKVTNLSDDVATTVIDIKGDTIDISKTAINELGFSKGQKDLCKDCQNIRFEECLPGDKTTPSREIYEYIRPLDRVILRRDWCSFCSLIFKVLCHEENDPLLHPHIQDHIQPSLKGVPFEDWAEKANLINRMFNSEAVWPFGLSREVPDGEAEVQKLFHPRNKDDELVIDESSPTVYQNSLLLDDMSDQLLVGALTAAKVTLFGDTDLSERDRRILEGVDGALTAAMIFSGNKRKRLPCWVLIKLHTRASSENGLLAVHVAAHNGEVLSPLAEVSRFHLRVATGDIVQSKKGSPLRYGKVLKEKIDLSLAKQWLEDCKLHHPCTLPPRRAEEGSRVSPLRVIDLERLCLHSCTSDSVQYAALSYVWGNYTYAKLDNRTVKIYFDRNALAPKRVNLPQAIIDAMKVARNIGLRYLWVDALCIKQDDESEKETQIGQMDKIYANAVVTIVAADGSNANAPLKGVSTTREISQVVSEIRPKVNVLIPIPTGKNLEPWETRAWTLQEKLLSNRLILFSGGYMTWHCREVVHFEDMTAKDAVTILGSHLGYPLLNFKHVKGNLSSAPFSYSPHDGTVSVVRSKAFQQYATLVADYTSRRMTYASDVLRALRGILPILNRAFGQIQAGEHEVFRYGLPQPILDLALLWQPEGKCERREHCKTCKQSYMPSWSWAGWVGEKNYGKPFAVRTDDKGALLQFPEEHGLERIRPLVRFYARGRAGLSDWPAQGTCAETEYDESNCSPLSEHHSEDVFTQQDEVVEVGLLSLLESDQTGLIWRSDDPQFNQPGSLPSWLQKQPPEEWEASSPRSAFAQRSQSDEYPTFDKWHLVFQTQVSQFKLRWPSQAQVIIREETLGGELNSSDSAPIDPMHILDNRGRKIGIVQVHEPEKINYETNYEFIVLSEAQYFGNEKSIDIVGYPLYNVMLVSGKEGSNVRTRLGLGKLYKHAWRLSDPVKEVVVLG